MKTVLFLLSLLLVSGNLFSQNFSWAQKWGGWEYDHGNAIAVDTVGNVYTTGYFQGTTDFDASQAVVSLTSDHLDIFITKTNALGELIWVKQIGGSGDDSGTSIVVDADGNVYVSGLFKGAVDFDPGPGTFILNSTAIFGNTFICKLNTNGGFIWAKRFEDKVISAAITVDANQNVYTTGNFRGISDFDPGTGVANLDGGVHSVFVSKLNQSGDYVWAKHFLKHDNDTLLAFSGSIAVDEDGNVYTTGGFEDTVDFDPGAGVFELNPVGMDIFISKLDPNGDFVWAQKFGSADYDHGLVLTLDGDANIYTVGLFSGVVDFDGSPATSTLTSGFYNGPLSWYAANLYVSKYDSDGNHIWSKGMVGPGEISGTGIALDNDGDIYIGGYFNMTIDMDPGPGEQIITTTGTVNHAQDIFYAKLSGTGDLIWGKTIGGTYHDRVLGLAVDGDKNLYMTGIFEDTVDFDPGSGVWELHENNLMSETPDVFLMKVSECMPTQSVQTVLAPCNAVYSWAANNELYQTSGIYKYVLPNEEGCDSIITLNLDIPVLVVEFENVNGVLTYTNPQPNETYQWIDCSSNQPIPGATQSTYTLFHSAIFAVIVTKGNCTVTSPCVSYQFVGLNELDEANIRLFPNPVQDQFTISVDSQLLAVEVTAINGQLVYSAQNPGNIFSASGWETGVYLVKVVTEKGSRIFRVVKD